MKKQIWLFVFFTFVLSCAHEDKDNYDETLRIGLSSLHYVEGKLVFPEINQEPEPQKIYFNDLQSVITSNCIKLFEENTAVYNDSEKFACYKSNVQGTINVNTESSKGPFNYKYNTCTQALYSCIGYKFLELAETQEAAVIEGRA